MSKQVWSFIASTAGIGYLPLAPGTWASLVAAFAWYGLQTYFPAFVVTQWVLVLACIIIGIISAGITEKNLGLEDPSLVVIDEVAGMWIACLLLPHKWIVVAIAFILFRFFDIAKPLGIRKLEKFKGGWGIMLDDILAGVYANLIIEGLLLTGVLKA